MEIHKLEKKIIEDEDVRVALLEEREQLRERIAQVFVFRGPVSLSQSILVNTARVTRRHTDRICLMENSLGPCASEEPVCLN